MLTFKQFLIETKPQPVPFKWITKFDDLWKAVFIINDSQYEVIFAPDEESPSMWEVVFLKTNRPEGLGLYDLTGTGNAFVLFSTVTNIVVDFAEKNQQVRVITFTAKESSRQRFYDRWAKQIANALGGWAVRILPRAVRKYILRRP